MPRRAARRGEAGGEDRGQMLILAGTVLLLAFLVVVFTVTELASEERRLQQGASNELPSLFRANQDKIQATLSGLVINSTDNATFLAAFVTSANEIQERGRAHGLHMVMTLANATSPQAARTEASVLVVDGTAHPCAGGVTKKYDISSHDNLRDYRPLSWDCADDGIVWDRDLKKIRGAAVFLMVATHTARLEDTFFVAVN